MRSKIKELRDAEKINQEDFAKRFDISRKTLSELENGKCSISLDLAFRIANHYNLTVEGVFENRHSFNSKTKFDYEEKRKKRYELWINEMLVLWKNKKVDEITKMFSDTCEYYETPFEKLETKNEITLAWEEIKQQKIKKLQYEIMGFQNNSCTIRVILKEFDGRVVDMIYIFELDDNNICTKFMQWFIIGYKTVVNIPKS